MRIAVTGATGLVGYQVARAAVEAGHEVVAPVRAGSTAHHGLTTLSATGRLERRRADLATASRMVEALEGCDALVHCAAVYAYGADRSAEVESVNVEGTRSVLEAAAAAGVARAVVTSSSVTCGSRSVPAACTEADAPHLEPSPAYYASKVAQEHAATEVAGRTGLEVVLALPTVVLGGPYGRLGPSNAIVLRHLLDPTRSTFAGGCNVVDARDVGSGHLCLLERGTPGERYLLGGEDVTWRELHGHVARLAGLPGPFLETPAATAQWAAGLAEAWARLTGGRPLVTTDEAATVGRYYWYSSARAAGLGYTARPVGEAVAASIAWLLAGDDLPRWVREALRVDPAVRSARRLIPRPLQDPPPAQRVRPPRPRRPRRPTHPR
ncbi:NAD-dependent epimerase/dehydratase family protein [Phycicoccus sp.]|uniref:NAD-dependent epimerase/dehydratase family protein n=1 Tax=Phycicoccus sp. TaxID=1902410 RepID=UPI002BE9002E|nr:NAD-dependent epimerase/dehydratase family protein [Phycicoccus sp.]HMM96815.1 NAD-dependent epimerase/dehydratase family protein [Phycicoccus sp.]